MNRNGQFFNYRRIKFAWSCWNEALLWTIHSKINGKKENTYSVKLLWICQANDPRSQRSKRSQIVIVIKLFRCKVNKFNLKFNLKTVNTAIHRHLFHRHHIAMTITREIMMGVGNRVASVIMLTFPSEPCPHADG